MYVRSYVYRYIYRYVYRYVFRYDDALVTAISVLTCVCTYVGTYVAIAFESGNNSKALGNFVRTYECTCLPTWIHTKITIFTN